jgi:hypothetical protein
LQALDQAIRVGHWKRYAEAQARMLEAEQFIILRRYSAALETLAACETSAGTSADFSLLRLTALRGAGMADEFRFGMGEAMDRFPRDTRLVRLLFDYAAAQKQDEDLGALVGIALKRLPFLVDSDPGLGWMAAPFTGDNDEARRMISAYRSGGQRPNPFSLIPALNFGLLDDIAAIDELFVPPVGIKDTLDRGLIVKVGDLLRSDEGRGYLAEKLRSFTGTIKEDEEYDGYAESYAVYRQGELQEFIYDADQDGLYDLSVIFDSGSPQWADVAALAMPSDQNRQGIETVNSWQRADLDRRVKALVFWEKYPSVQRAALGKETFLFAPGYFQFAPVNFERFEDTGDAWGFAFPRFDPLCQGINRRMLASFAVTVQRPSAEFDGGLEQIHLERGVPIRAEVTLGGKTVSVTEYENGRPVIQRLDLDLDGYMDTIRRFRRSTAGARNPVPLGADELLDFRPPLESVEKTR